MSRYRNIHCLIWNDDKFPFASDNCQLVWFHLFTTPMTNPIGIYKAPIEGLAAEKRWKLEKYKKAFNEGLNKGFWRYDEKFHVILFPNYFTHNKPANPNVLKSWVKHYDEIPNCILKNESMQSLKAFAKGWGNPFESITESMGVTFAKQEQEQEQEQEHGKPENGYKEKAKEILSALNLKSGKNFKETKNNLKHIIARLSDNFTVSDCMKVLDTKIKDEYFIEKPKYYNPETLFRPSNFEKYLNENAKSEPETIRVECPNDSV